MAAQNGDDLYRCACGFTGNLFQVMSHQNARRRARDRWPQCQGAPTDSAGQPVGDFKDRASAALRVRRAETAAKRGTWKKQAAPKEPELPAEPAVSSEDAPADSESGPPATAAGQNGGGPGPRRSGSPPANPKVLGTSARTLFQESVKLSTTPRTLYDLLVEEGQVTDTFEVCLEKCFIWFWEDRGYELGLVIRSPKGKLAAVAAEEG